MKFAVLGSYSCGGWRGEISTIRWCAVPSDREIEAAAECLRPMLPGPVSDTARSYARAVLEAAERVRGWRSAAIEEVMPIQPLPPYVVEGHHQYDGSITYEVWDFRPGSYRRLCSLNEWYDGGKEKDGRELSTARADAELIARALNLLTCSTAVAVKGPPGSQVEITPEMIDAGWDAYYRLADEPGGMNNLAMAEIFKAMLAISPK